MKGLRCGPVDAHRSVRRRRFVAGLVFVLAFPSLLTPVGFSALAGEPLRVFAAASLAGALTEIVNQHDAASDTRSVPVFGASSTLARQIMHGAPAGVFISANPQWMEMVEKAGLIVAGTRTELLGNELVLIAPADSLTSFAFGKDEDIATALTDGPLALGDPAHVPAGIYAKAALTNTGLWPAVKNRISRSADVRAALVLVERGEAPLGVVYASDLTGRRSIRRVATFPRHSYPAITYPVAAVKSADVDRARAFLAFLQTDPVRAIFEHHGFSTQ